MKNFIIKLIASGFFTSYGKFFYPGSRGTIPAWMIAYFLVRGNQPLIIILAGVFTVFSVYVSNLAEPIWGRDAKKIVIDEWAGMMITIILLPYSLLNYIIAFVVFRLADAVKIPPARNAEKLPRGWGVTADDIIAGVQANLITQLIVYIINNYI
jgi:phosphatidylglycerophosphatase A